VCQLVMQWALNHPEGAQSVVQFANNVARGTSVWTGGSCEGDGCATGALLGAVMMVSGTAHLPGGAVPDEAIVVRGGESPVPPSGETFSGAAGSTLEDAAQGVPHGKIRATTAGKIRAGGGTVVSKPEPTRSGVMNQKHVDICLGSGPCPFGEIQPNPVPKPQRIH
jgi:hypothetical protein